MKKNLITALKKLVTSFGGKAESNNAVDLVDEFADVATDAPKLPEATSADAGKVPIIQDDGSYALAAISGGGDCNLYVIKATYNTSDQTYQLDGDASHILSSAYNALLNGQIPVLLIKTPYYNYETFYFRLAMFTEPVFTPNLTSMVFQTRIVTVSGAPGAAPYLTIESFRLSAKTGDYGLVKTLSVSFTSTTET